MVASFDRAWDILLIEYTTAFLQYGVFAGLIGLALRARRRVPVTAVVCALTAGAAIASETAAWAWGRHVDTAMIGLALIAAAVTVRIDRAVFGEAGPPGQTVGD
jgi:hypothetical protein